MTMDDAVILLEAAGLTVSRGEDSIATATDFQEPHPLLRSQGVTAVAAFGLNLRKHDSTWFLRHQRPPAPPEQFPDLDEAVTRALAIFEIYRRTNS